MFNLAIRFVSAGMATKKEVITAIGCPVEPWTWAHSVQLNPSKNREDTSSGLWYTNADHLLKRKLLRDLQHCPSHRKAIEASIVASFY